MEKRQNNSIEIRYDAQLKENAGTAWIDRQGVFSLSLQGFMQDQIASHECFGGHMDVNC